MYTPQFAALYDSLMEDFDYPAWADYYLELIRESAGGKPKHLCECGCGTGNMALEWAAKGIRVTGVDLSAPMLQVASDKARKRGLSLTFVCQDMTRLALHRPVDAIACPCDGVNYLLDDEAVASFFARAHQSLRPGGALVFDVSTPHKLFGMEGAPYYEDREDLTYLWTGRRRGELVDMALTFFLRRGGGLYQRFDEMQTQRAHRAEDLVKALEKAGFTGIALYGDRRLDPPEDQELRWHFAARKKGASQRPTVGKETIGV